MEISFLTIGQGVPQGIAITGRGNIAYTYPEPEKNPNTQKFIQDFEARYGEFPIYPAFRGAQTVGRWPTKEEVAKALEGLEFDSPGGLTAFYPEMRDPVS